MLGFGPLAVYGAVYFARHGEVWHFAGFPAYGDGPFESIGVPTSVDLLVGFAAVCAAEVVVGVLLWRQRRIGLWLSLALLPLEVAYWIGFALPFGPLLGVARGCRHRCVVAVGCAIGHTAARGLGQPHVLCWSGDVEWATSGSLHGRTSGWAVCTGPVVGG